MPYLRTYISFIGRTILAAASLLIAAPSQAALTLTTLASFTGPGTNTNGGYPVAGVTFDPSGNLFGTTEVGGMYGQGVVYEIVKGSKTITDIATFNGTTPGTNGGYPFGGVTRDSNGNLFGSTSSGGKYGNGTVFEVANGSNALTDLVSFNSSGPSATGDSPRSGVTLDTNGNIFGTTFFSGAHGAGEVYELASGSGTINVLASFNSEVISTTGGGPYAGVTLDGNGNLYGTTYRGGAYGAGVVYEIAQGSGVITVLASFGGNGAGTNGGSPFTGLTLDAAGNLFGTTANGGTTGNGTVFEIAKGSGVITDIASFTGTGVGTNGAQPDGDVIFDAAGNLFGVTEYGGTYGYGTTYEIVKGSGVVTVLVTFTDRAAGSNGGSPGGVLTFDSSGNLFGTTFSGGAFGAGTVYEIAGAGVPAPDPSPVATLMIGFFIIGALTCKAKKCVR